MHLESIYNIYLSLFLFLFTQIFLCMNVENKRERGRVGETDHSHTQMSDSAYTLTEETLTWLNFSLF